MKWICVQIDREITVQMNVYNLRGSNSSLSFLPPFSMGVNS